MTEPDLSDHAYRALAQFRLALRNFLAFSERAAHTAGMESQQHQLLLALRGLNPAQQASVGQLAEWLAIQHHSAVELIDRAERHGWVMRQRDACDRRRVVVSLTQEGRKALAELSRQHREELRSASPALLEALNLLAAQPVGGDFYT